MVYKEERKSLQEKKRLEWQRNWEALDLELAREMDILMELVPEPMEVEGTIITHHSGFMGSVRDQKIEMDYQLEDVQMEMETFEDWLEWELLEIDWD